MSLRIATNVQSLAAQRFLTNNTNTLNKSLERLSSGSRINRAGDDAAGAADLVQRQPGDGTRGRGDPAHLADSAQDEGPARQAAR